MGITNLLPFLKPIAKSTHISKYKNEVVGVDIMCWIHRGLISCAYDIVTDNYNDSYLSFIEKMLECIYHYNIKVVFVFDGEELPEKKAENIIRKDRREKAKKEAQEIIKSVANPRSNEMVLKKCIQALSVTKEIINRVIHFCKTKNIDYIISPFEADAQLSYLCRMGYISCAISEDSDLLVYGCPRVLYKLKSTGECDEISLMPIDDLIDVNVINKIRNPLSNSFNDFYITPMKEGLKDAEGGHSGGEDHNVSDLEDHNVSGWEQNNVPDWEQNNVSDLAERPPARSQRRTSHRAAANRNHKQKKKSYHKVMKEYLDHFYWPEELDKLKHFNIDMFLAMCILSGCDYTNDFHITGMGIKTAFSLISQHKTIENIFSFLISHDKWKRKIPSSLNTLEKLLAKYEEIKNAFLHHQVYDFILCENISINQSFNSALKKNENKLLINKICDFSLIYDNSKRRGNCLNVYSEELSSDASGGRSSLLPDGSGSSEGCTERSTKGEEKVDTVKQHHPKAMLKGKVSPEAPSKISPVPPKQTTIKEYPYLDKPNNFENIFKNLTSECLEYLEISPDLFRNCHEGQNDLKEQEVARHEGTGEHPLGKYYMGSAQEGSHGSTSGWTSGWQSGRQNYVACHPGEYPPNETAKEEPPKGDTQTHSPLHPRGTTQMANLWPPMECTKLSLFGDSPRSNGCAYGKECTNDEDEDEDEAGVLRDTIEPSDHPAYNSRNNQPRGKEKTKLSKRKGDHAYSVNFKKTKRSAAASPHTDDQTWRNLLDKKEPDCSKLSGQNNPGEILENAKWISQSGGNCQGMARLKKSTAHGIDTSIQQDATKGKSQKQQKEEEGGEEEDGEVTNPTGGTNRKKSARAMYQNMKRSFVLFKTLDGETSNKMGSSTTELKRNSTQEKVECAHVREIQGRRENERPDEEGENSVETDIWDRKDKMGSGAQGKPMSNPTSEQTSGVKYEIDKTNFKLERSDHPSGVSSPRKSKSPAVNENRRSQLRITNFFKKLEPKIPDLDGNKEDNNNTFPLRQPTNDSPNGNGKYSLSMNNWEPANKEQRWMNSPNELGIYERRVDGRMTKYKHRFSLQSNTEQQGGELPYGVQEIHDQDTYEKDAHEKDALETDAHETDTHDEYTFLKNLHNCGLIKDPNRKESQKWVVKGSQTLDDRGSREDSADQGEVRRSDNHNDGPNDHSMDHSTDHPKGHHDRPFLGDAPHDNFPAEKKEKQKEINLEYILQNLNYNYHPRSHKINTFDYFKEKENVPPPNPYVDNNL